MQVHRRIVMWMSLASVMLFAILSFSLVAASTREFTRKGEGDVIELNDGRLLLVYMEFSGSGSDFAKTRLVAQESEDVGRTWGQHRVITDTTPGGISSRSGAVAGSSPM